MKYNSAFSFIIILLYTLSINAQTSKNPMLDSSVYLNNPNYTVELDLFDVYKMKRAKIVMLGNSITHRVNWNELLNRSDIVERGVGGDLTIGFLHRLKQVYKLRPKICFIMGGLNDLFYGLDVKIIFQNQIQIIDSLRTHNIKTVLQSILYIGNSSKFWSSINIRIKKLNSLLKNYAIKNNIVFLDLNKKMSKNNHIKKELTIDGIHLNAKGYKIWGNEVEKVLFNYLN